MKNERDVHVADQIVGLEGLGSHLDATDHCVTILARLGFRLDVGQKEIDVFVHWNIETGVPLAVDVVEGNKVGGHGWRVECWLAEW